MEARGCLVVYAFLLLLCVYEGNAALPTVADAWFQTTRCDELSTADVCVNYERCKRTHRCARGDEDYYIKEARHESFTRQFAGGTRAPIALMNDFEDWKSGTHGWGMQDSDLYANVALGLDTFDFVTIGSLELAAGYVVFNTDKATVWGDVSFKGALTTTKSGTKVAVFNFMTVYLGQGVKVRFVGNQAVSILSRSSMIIDTELRARPGTLGGFPGGGFVGVNTRNNNQNGPGSPSVRVYVKTVSTHGTHVPEIQEIETSAAPGQKIQGHFTVSYGLDGHKTQPIRYDATSYEVQKYLENAFPDIGSLHVERDDTRQQVPEVGRLWRITFLTAVGNVPQLQVQSFLSGLASQVVSRTISEGNELSGTFRLQLRGAQTQELRYDITAPDLRTRLLADFPFLLDARVSRTDATAQCLQGSNLPDQSASTSISNGGSDDRFRPSEWLVPNELRNDAQDSVKNYRDKLCAGGRGAANGYVWKIQMWTTVDNAAASSPSSSVYLQTQAPLSLIADQTKLVGTGATIEIIDSLHFSLAFGGTGASFASKGGDGYSIPFRRRDDYMAVYSSEEIPDLLGGSGGSGGGQEPIDVFPVVQPTLGGAGGGALHLSAINDILIGSSGKIITNGANGGSGYTAGGGGSGGSILIDCGGTIAHHGSIEAVGGHGGASTPFNSAQFSMPGGGGSGGRVAIFAQSFATWKSGVIVVSGGASQDSTRAGGQGSTYVRVKTPLAIRVDPSIGAAGTSKSILVAGAEDYALGAKIGQELPDHTRQLARNGPRKKLPLQSRPERISYFVRIGQLKEGGVTVNEGAVFGIHSSDDTKSSSANKDHFMIAVGIIDGTFTHEADTYQIPRRSFQVKAQSDRWYKLDILLDWVTKTYSIQLNDVLKVLDAPFTGSAITSISLNNYHAMSSWWDEVYVGDNHLKDFKCPYLASTSGQNGNEGVVVTKTRSLRKLWPAESRGPATTYHPMTKHESHLSKREVYQYDSGGMLPFDGAPHRAFLNDVRETESELQDGTSQEELNANEEVITQAETLTLQDVSQDSSIVLSLETGMDLHTLAADQRGTTRTIQSHGPTIYWYSEIYNTATGFGGVGACSTLNYIDWRNEGIMLHFVNLTDPFGQAVSPLVADRPKVLFNKKTNQFIMWMHVDITTNTMGLTGVAVSAYPNGPFHFVHSFYPDAPLESPGGMSINETHDQTIAIIPASDTTQPDRAYLIRTFFKTVEYWLPRPVMDPLWESVRDENDKTQFGLSYHRAFYHEGYDNPNDIYLQRWRMEDMPWEVVCCKPTDPTNCVVDNDVPSDPARVCPDGFEKKQVLGQSQMEEGSHIQSRYKDPLDDTNNFFIPNSVPSHTTWGFQVHNIKSWRGNYFDALSTNITNFMFHRFADERRRQAIENDSTIPFVYPNEEEQIDFIPVDDKELMSEMLGTLGVPMSVAFKAKYSSYDLAEIDLNNDGKITAYELSAMIEKRSHKKLSQQLVDSILIDFEEMKWNQVKLLDADSTGKITFAEFEAWVGLDPNLLFDRFDLDKSGFLDENELARLLWYRQFPRLDQAIILLDPSFDGRVYYPRFRALLQQAPGYMFGAYDFDKSGVLTQDEIELMIKDLGLFARRNVIESLKDVAAKGIKKADYVKWLSASTSLLADARNGLKVDNAVHATRPDSLTGPMHVIERRRAKYVAISRLSSDYLSTEGLLKEVEGDFEGREALLNYFAFAEDLFGLQDEEIQASFADMESPGTQPFRVSLSSEMLGDRASYWNGRHWEGRPSAPALFTYGTQCLQYAGVDGTDPGCMPCLTRSPFVTASVDQYQTQTRSTFHCRSYKEMDAYIKQFDQQVSIQLQYQQQSAFGPQGLQPHMSPCFNQSQFFPCDVHKVVDGNIADSLRDMNARSTPWNLEWESHPDNTGSSQKIRADDVQRESQGPSFIERFPNRNRELPNGLEIDGDIVFAPDQMADILGGGS
ncbi:hypothetical protein Poli38472_009568 [Pythium oligandrum]|uniref:EF-hand domain-containing protein n=1 Tax=Pythium oligandrum TaxID=41045 RepID=A0A8K1CG07_PYTOL|nr:hypothetical protein Poli38472_009568 [Pythium oligandrum]|eukprot:TMW62075.1 hypothetical protein Poli38472_009568 [Pythium oligandrum]